MQPIFESNYFTRIKEAIFPVTPVPIERGKYSENVRSLDEKRGMMQACAIGLAVLGYLVAPPMKATLGLIGGAYLARETSTVAKNLQAIYLNGEKEAAAASSDENFLNAITENAPLCRRILPYCFTIEKLRSYYLPIEKKE